MAKLPELSPMNMERVVHSEPPQSSVTLGQIKSPYLEFSNALNELGSGLAALGKKFKPEKEEDEDATKDKTGRARGRGRGRRKGKDDWPHSLGGKLARDINESNPTGNGITPVGDPDAAANEPWATAPPPNGRDAEMPPDTSMGRNSTVPVAKPAGPDKVAMDDSDAYSRLVNMKSMVSGEQQATAGIANLAAQNPTDPQAFIAAAEAYKDETIKQYGEAGAPAVAKGLDHSIDQAINTNLSDLLRKKRDSDISATQQGVATKLDDLSATMQAEALAGRVSGEAFRSAQADYKAIHDEARGNHLYGMHEDRLHAHLENALAQTREAALIGSTRRAFAMGGEYAAQEYVDDHLHHMGLDEESEQQLKQQLYADIGSQVAKERADQRKMQKVHDDARDARTNEGYRRIADGSLDQNWLDQHYTQINSADRSALQRAMYAPDPETTTPAARADLTALAVASPKAIPIAAAEALSNGDLSRHDFNAMLDLSTQVIDDQKKRPWRNDLRSNLSRWPDAIGELTDFMGANPDVGRTKIREFAETIKQQFIEGDYRNAAARLPPLPFATEMPQDYTLETVSLSAGELLKRERDGRISPDDLVDQVTKLKMWRDLMLQKMQQQQDDKAREDYQERYRTFSPGEPSGNMPQRMNERRGRTKTAEVSMDRMKEMRDRALPRMEADEQEMQRNRYTDTRRRMSPSMGEPSTEALPAQRQKMQVPREFR